MNKLRMGMVGGGPNAFIGAIHRAAAALDGEIELCCGAFSRDAQQSRVFGESLGLAPDRVYDDYQSLFEKEANLPVEKRMQFVSIVTPNNMHYPIADAALTSGFNVLCDKPATLTLDECQALARRTEQTNLVFGLTHTYTGYAMVKEARQRIMNGELGTIRKVITEYHQGWLAAQVFDGNNKQAAWRLDPAQAGQSCCMGDIGVHAANLAEYVTGLRISAVLADLGRVEPGRVLDDDGTVLLRFEGETRGVLLASQISLGEENCLRIRAYGDSGSLEWHQEEPNTLLLKRGDQPTQILRAGHSYLSAPAQAVARTPPGHPEGYIEAFANIYRDFACMVSQQQGKGVDTTNPEHSPERQQISDLPGIAEALRGMAFIEQVVASDAAGCQWRSIEC